MSKLINNKYKNNLLSLAIQNTSSDSLDSGFYSTYHDGSRIAFSGLVRRAGGGYELFSDLQSKPNAFNISNNGYLNDSLKISKLLLTDMLNQIEIGGTVKTILNISPPSNTRTIKIKDSGTDSEIMQTENINMQIINGPKSFKTLTIGSSTYSVGTISQLNNTITGYGTTFLQTMVGGIVVFQNGQSAFITAWNSTTSLNCAQSFTITEQTYVLYYDGFQIDYSNNLSTKKLNVTGAANLTSLNLTNQFNQIIFGNNYTTTLNAPQPTSNIILNLPNSANDTLVSRATAETLTNKTLTGATNTLTASFLKSSTTEISISGATAPSAGQVLTATSSTNATWQSLSSLNGFIQQGGNNYGADISIGSTDSYGLNLITHGQNRISMDTNGLVTIYGNLNVLGSTTTINSSTIQVTDSILELATSNTNDIIDIGLAAPYINSGTKYTGLIRDASDSTKAYKLIQELSTTPSSSVATYDNNLADLYVKTLYTNAVNIRDTNDVSKKLLFDISGQSTNYTTTVSTSSTNNRTLTLPDISDILVSRTNTETLTNKTLTGATNTVTASLLKSQSSEISISGAQAPQSGQLLTASSSSNAAWKYPYFNDNNLYVLSSTDNTARLNFTLAGANSNTTTTILSSSTNNRTLTLPDISDTLVSKDANQTLNNKNLGTVTTYIIDSSVNSKRLNFQLSGASSNSTMTFNSSHTTDRILTLPDLTDNLVSQNSTDTLTNKTINGSTNTVTASLLKSQSTEVSISGSQAPQSGQLLIATSTTNAVWKDPKFNDNIFQVVSSTDSSKYLKITANGTSSTNTTILSNQTTNRILTLPDITDTLVTKSSTDTLSNKTLTGSNNVVTASLLKSQTTEINIANSSAPQVGQILMATSTTNATWQTPSFKDTDLTIYDSSDSTKKINFDAAGSTSTVTTILSSQTLNRTLTLPDITDTLVTRTNLETLTNKTLLTPTISTIINSGTLTLPTSTDTLVGRTTTDTLTNKTLISPTISTIVNTGTLTLPTSTDTLVGRTTTDTLTNKTLLAPTISTIVNTGTLTLPATTDTLVGRTTTDILGNKTLLSGSTTIADSTDSSKKLAFNISGFTTATTRNYVFPDISDTIATLTSSQTMSNKTLLAPTISTIVNTGTLTLPTSTDILVGRATTDTLTNKTLLSGSTIIADSTDSTKKLAFNISGFTTATTRTFILPNTSDTLVGRTTTDILTNKTLLSGSTIIADSTDSSKKLAFNITGFTTATTRNYVFPDISDTVVTLTSAQTLTNKTLTSPIITQILNTGTLTLPTSTDTLIGRTTTDILSNKTLLSGSTIIADSTDNTKKLAFNVAGFTTSTTHTFTLPDTSDTLVTLSSAQTLTNKTFATPNISQINNGGILTLPTITDTLVGRITTDILTNKTIIDSTNIILGYHKISNTLYVDAQYGNNATASVGGLPFATIAAALAVATTGMTVFVNVGTYSESSLSIPDGVTLRGRDMKNTVISIDNATSNTTIMTVNTSNMVQDVLVSIASSTANITLTGILFTGTSTLNSRLRNVNVSITNMVTGTVTIYGIRSNGTGQPLSNRQTCVTSNIIVAAANATSGTVRAAYIDGNNTIGFSNCMINASGAVAASCVAVETNSSSSICNLLYCNIQGSTNDYLQTLGTIYTNVLATTNGVILNNKVEIPTSSNASAQKILMANSATNATWQYPLFDVQGISDVTTVTTTSTTLVDLTGATLTTKNVGANAIYQINFNCVYNISGANTIATFQLNINDVDITNATIVIDEKTTSTRNNVSFSYVHTTALASGIIIKIRYSTSANTLTISRKTLNIFGISSNWIAH
jgi:hypothetical protein